MRWSWRDTTKSHARAERHQGALFWVWEWPFDGSFTLQGSGAFQNTFFFGRQSQKDSILDGSCMRAMGRNEKDVLEILEIHSLKKAHPTRAWSGLRCYRTPVHSCSAWKLLKGTFRDRFFLIPKSWKTYCLWLRTYSSSNDSIYTPHSVPDERLWPVTLQGDYW